ncbi:DUF3592 domain-containing protein [Candidatus Peregrinibacteria bacterium]|nr:DUF3592 domain-containing protein [Candidatus Peregrinibacteria bacterium]
MYNETFQNLSSPKSDKQIWTIGLVFLGIGIFLAIILPILIIRTPDETTKVTDGFVIDYAVDSELEEEDPIYAEIYSFQSSDGIEREITSDIWSTEPSYAIGDRVEIYYNSENPDDAWVKDDKNLAIMIMVMQILGGVFGLIGLVVTALKMRNLDNNTINNVGGLIGALAFGIPSTFAFPIIALINSGKADPSSTTSKLSEGDFIIGIIFTILGIAVTIAAIMMFRYQQKNGTNGVFVSFNK